MSNCLPPTFAARSLAGGPPGQRLVQGGQCRCALLYGTLAQNSKWKTARPPWIFASKRRWR